MASNCGVGTPPRFHLSEDRARRKASELVEEFDGLLTRAVERCLVSDVPVALLLSDGIDSRSIWAVLRARGRDVPAYTFTPVTGGETETEEIISEPGVRQVRVPVRDRHR